MDALVSMGFDRGDATTALRTKGTREKALEYLIENNKTPQKVKSTQSGSKPKKKKSTPKLSRAEKKRKKEMHQKREKERTEELAALKAMEEKKADDLKKRTIELKKEMAAQAESRKQQDEREKRAAKARAELKAIEKQKQIENERWAKRAAAEKTITSTEAALKEIEENYGPTRLALTCKTLSKIMKKIIQNPGQDKYKSIKLSSDIVQRAIVRPLGAWVYARRLGFQLNEARTHLVMSVPNTALLEREIQRLTKNRDALSTVIVGLFSSVNVNDSAEVERTYFALLELKSILHNVIALPEERNFRSVDTESEMYLRRLSPVKAALATLSHFGYKEHKNSEGKAVYLIVERPDLARFEAGLLDITKELLRLSVHTPIFLATHQLFKQNPVMVAANMTQQLQGAVNRILLDPHEQKYHKFNISKFFKRTGPVVGGYDFIQLFGFTLDLKANHARMPYPKGFDEQLIRLRYNDLTRSLPLAQRAAN